MSSAPLYTKKRKCDTFEMPKNGNIEVEWIFSLPVFLAGR